MIVNAGLRKGYQSQSLEDASRMILLYCLNTYKGDEKIKSFVWDLVTPSEHGGQEKVGKNHSGLSGPVPRGRKAKKSADRKSREETMAWTLDEKYDTEKYLDKSYRKHLDRHNNKILLRIRMLYYIRHEVLADYINQINTPGFPVR